MGLHVVSCTPSGGIHSNPKTVAAMIRVNGLEDVRRSGLVAPDVLGRAIELAGPDHIAVANPAAISNPDEPMVPARIVAAALAAMGGDANPLPIRVLQLVTETADIKTVLPAAQLWKLRQRFGRDAVHKIAGLDRDGRLALVRSLGFGMVCSTVRRVSAQKIMKRACQLFGVTMVQLRSRCRVRRLVLARHFAMYWIRRRTSLSLPEIARLFGGRDHTTILHAVQVWPEKRDMARGFVQVKGSRLDG